MIIVGAVKAEQWRCASKTLDFMTRAGVVC